MAKLEFITWRRIFVTLTTTIVVSIVVAVAGTIIFEMMRPADCSACGMAAVGLVPFYLVAMLFMLLLAIALIVCAISRRSQATAKVFGVFAGSIVLCTLVFFASIMI